MKKICVMLLALVVTLGAGAQSSSLEDMLKVRAAEKVGQMCDYIEFLASKDNDYETRKYYRDKALHLFINNGESYEEDGVYKEGVAMEVTSVYRSKPRRRLMRDYFTGLMNLRYAAVQIQSTDVANIEVSRLHQVDENLFVCTCYFEQAFAGYNENGVPVYRDITRKKVKCYVYRELIEPGVGEDGEANFEFIVVLGDVTALETRRV